MTVSKISDEQKPTFRTESTMPQSSGASQSPEQQAQFEKVYAEMRQHALEIREELMAEIRPLPAEQLASHLSPASTAEKIDAWRQAGEVFSVPYNGVNLYPTFQFDNGRPKKVVARVLKLLRDERPSDEAETPYLDWDIMCWFVEVNSWLEGATPDEAGIPIKRMDADPGAVVVAASHARDRISD